MKLRKILGVGVLAIIGLAAIWTWDPLPANPSFEELSKGSQKYTVEIIRDNWGVPHIYGKTDADTVFGFAYAHAEDDFETIQLSIAATRGVLARYHGKDAAPTDYIVSLFEIWETIEQKYDQDIPQDVKKRLQMAMPLGLIFMPPKTRTAHGKAWPHLQAKILSQASCLKHHFFMG